MPPWFYVAIHPEARLSEADREALLRWAQESAAPRARGAGRARPVSDGAPPGPRFLYRALRARWRDQAAEIRALEEAIGPGEAPPTWARTRALPALALEGRWAFGRVVAFEPQPELAAYLAAPAGRPGSRTSPSRPRASGPGRPGRALCRERAAPRRGPRSSLPVGRFRAGRIAVPVVAPRRLLPRERRSVGPSRWTSKATRSRCCGAPAGSSGITRPWSCSSARRAMSGRRAFARPSPSSPSGVTGARS